MKFCLNFFAGSFTAPKVAAEIGRNGVGVELNKKMFGDSIIKNLKKTKNLFSNVINFEEFNLLDEAKENKQI